MRLCLPWEPCGTDVGHSLPCWRAWGAAGQDHSIIASVSICPWQRPGCCPGSLGSRGLSQWQQIPPHTRGGSAKEKASGARHHNHMQPVDLIPLPLPCSPGSRVDVSLIKQQEFTAAGQGTLRPLWGCPRCFLQLLLQPALPGRADRHYLFNDFQGVCPDSQS